MAPRSLPFPVRIHDPGPPCLYGISFDGVAASGITAEFIKLAAVYHARGYRVALDLGYDVKPDKDAFFRPYGDEGAALPPWVELERVPGIEQVPGYGPDLVRAASRGDEGADAGLALRAARAADEIATRLVARWHALNVAMVVVENGTLPENVVFTRAVRAAIHRYGRERGLGKYVLWRDHDVMWFCEPEKYGAPPYRHACRPRRSPHVHHAALTEPAARALGAWVPGTPVAVIPNCFEFRRAPRTGRLRAALGIPPDAFVVARCTRVIPQKRIDREIVLLRLLAALGRAHGFARPLHLVVSGPTGEHRDEAAYLRRLAESLGVAGQVHFADGLAPCRAAGDALSVTDLLGDADLSSFLTSYRYEGFGNPPGEACAHGVPFVSSRYELYDAVYGRAGLRALLLPTAHDDDGAPDDAWAAALLHRIADADALRDEAAHNHRAAREHFSLEHLERRLDALFPHSAAGTAPAARHAPPRTATAQ